MIGVVRLFVETVGWNKFCMMVELKCYPFVFCAGVPRDIPGPGQLTFVGDLTPNESGTHLWCA